MRAGRFSSAFALCAHASEQRTSSVFWVEGQLKFRLISWSDAQLSFSSCNKSCFTLNCPCSWPFLYCSNLYLIPFFIVNLFWMLKHQVHEDDSLKRHLFRHLSLMLIWWINYIVKRCLILSLLMAALYLELGVFLQAWLLMKCIWIQGIFLGFAFHFNLLAILSSLTDRAWHLFLTFT